MDLQSLPITYLQMIEQIHKYDIYSEKEVKYTRWRKN